MLGLQARDSTHLIFIISHSTSNEWSGNFWFHWRLHCVLWCVSGSCLVKGHVPFCWSRRLRGHVVFGKSISMTHQTDSGWHPGIGWASLTSMTLWHWFGWFSSQIFACGDFVERKAPKDFWRRPGCFLLLQQTGAHWWGLSGSSGQSHCCWFEWIVDKEEWKHSKEWLLNRSTLPLVLLTIFLPYLWLMGHTGGWSV